MNVLTNVLLEAGWHTSFAGKEILYESLSADSRKLNDKTIFFAFDGLKHKGKDFILGAIVDGACAIFTDRQHEKEVIDQLVAKNISLEKTPVFFSDNFIQLSGKTASLLYNSPSEKMPCLAVTGTNGKTTTAWALFKTLRTLGKRPSYVGTIGIELPEESSVAVMTTPPLIEVHHILRRAMEQHGDHAIFETSSHGLKQGRLEGVQWSLGMFTNLTEDHRDYHVTMEDYFLSKRILFEDLLRLPRKDKEKLPAAIINVDDSYGLKLFQWMKFQDPGFNVISFGRTGEFEISEINPKWEGYEARLEFSQKQYLLRTRLIGNFNIYNLAMAFCALLLLGYNAGDALEALGNLEGAPGRMEVYRLRNGGMIVIDYAHTPDALRKAIETIRELHPEKVTVVFGCGGDRDQEKRPAMGQIVEEFADFGIITNDNPRTEDPQKIISQIQSGMKKKNHRIETDRRKAIEDAARNLSLGEVLLVAGKGHEDYQILPEGRIHFSDREIVAELCEKISPVIKEIK